MRRRCQSSSRPARPSAGWRRYPPDRPPRPPLPLPAALTAGHLCGWRCARMSACQADDSLQLHVTTDRLAMSAPVSARTVIEQPSQAANAAMVSRSAQCCNCRKFVRGFWNRTPLEGVVEVDQAEIPFRVGDTYFEPGNAGKILIAAAIEVIDRDTHTAKP